MAIKEKQKRLLRVDFTNRKPEKYFNDTFMIKDPEAYTEEERTILKAMQKEKLSYRVLILKDMSFTEKMDYISKIMESMHHMIIYELEE